MLFISQIISGRSSLEDRKKSAIRIIQIDSLKYNKFIKTATYKKLLSTNSKDSIELYLLKFFEEK